jgi:hypothetical protein
MSWQQYATYDPISPVNQAFPGGFAQGQDVPISQMPAGMGFGNAGGGFNMSQLGGLLNFAKMGMGMVGMGNTANSMNQMQRTAGIFGDIGTGRDYHAAESDFERQMRAAQWGNKFKATDPFLRQNELYANLKNPGIAGRYGAFVS